MKNTTCKEIGFYPSDSVEEEVKRENGTEARDTHFRGQGQNKIPM
jgi:hypothetical protein